MGCKCSCIEEYQLGKCTLENTPWLSLDGQNKFMKVVEVYDADTITVAFFLHGKKYLKKLRLLGIDSAELHPKKKRDGQDYKYREEEIKHAQRGKERMKELCLNKTIYVKCGDWDKYGRLLATVYDKSYSKKSYNDILIGEGLAYEYNGSTKRKFEDWYDWNRFGRAPTTVNGDKATQSNHSSSRTN